MLFFFNSHNNPRTDVQGQMPKDIWLIIAKAGKETLKTKATAFSCFFFTYLLLTMLLFITTFVDFSVVHYITQVL